MNLQQSSSKSIHALFSAAAEAIHSASEPVVGSGLLKFVTQPQDGLNKKLRGPGYTRKMPGKKRKH